MLKEGDEAPELELPGDRGETVRLRELRGRPVVLFFYPKDNTSGCTKEAVGFSCMQSDFAALGVEVIGISPDGLKSHGRFREKHGLTVALLADEDKRAIAAYGAWAEKSMAGRKYMGVERSTFLIGRDGRIARIWRKVKIPGHVEAVLAAAKAL